MRQMLTFARKTEVLIESVTLNDVVHEVIRLLQETFPKTIGVVLHLEEQLPAIEADATQLHQVMLNLCVNARDAMPGGGTLTVATRLTSGNVIRPILPRAIAEQYLALSIADTGTGMDEATLARIFEPFFTTKERGRGTGLGLSLVFGIMESHNGFVTVNSELGHGTMFCCYFPVTKQSIVPNRDNIPRTESIHGGSEGILLVEDEEMLRAVVTTILEDKGYTVFAAGDGEEAIAVFMSHGHDIHLVLSDLGLPKFGGDELYRKLKEKRPDIRMILATGYVEPGMKAELLAEGVVEIIQKPYHQRDVLLAIRHALGS